MSTPTIGEDWIAAMPSRPGWDSYDAKTITTEAIATVRSIYVVPCAHGGIQLEIHRDAFNIEIEIGADGRIIGTTVAHGEESPR